MFCENTCFQKKKNWIRNMIITNMERCRGWLLFFERKGKMVRNEANSDSHRMQRSSDCGYLGDGYHQIHLPN